MKSIASLVAFALLAAGPAAAATVPFTAFVSDGPFAGLEGFGEVTYDETLVAALGESVLTPLDDPTLDVALDAAGLSFGSANDDGFPAFPALFFIDGIFANLDYRLVTGVNGVDLSEFGIAFVQFGEVSYDLDGGAFVEASIELAAVPVPAAMPLLLLGLGAFGAARRRRA